MNNGSKFTDYIEANVMNISPKFQLDPPMASEDKIFYFFLSNLANPAVWTRFIWLVENYFCKTFVKICEVRQQHISHYKSKEIISCHSNQSSYPIGTKTQLFVPPPIRAINMKYGMNWLHGFREEVV